MIINSFLNVLIYLFFMEIFWSEEEFNPNPGPIYFVCVLVGDDADVPQGLLGPSPPVVRARIGCGVRTEVLGRNADLCIICENKLSGQRYSDRIYIKQLQKHSFCVHRGDR